jgi:hypothetical protein
MRKPTGCEGGALTIIGAAEVFILTVGKNAIL